MKLKPFNILVNILGLIVVVCSSGLAVPDIAVANDKGRQAFFARDQIRPNTHHLQAVGIWKEPLAGIEFVKIPPGCFQMGNLNSRLEKYGHEKPVHKVCVDGFWLGRFEVTNAQFRKFVPNHHSGDYMGYTLNGDDQPVVLISWYDARRFADWLTEQSDGKHRFRLPTEAEWEYACRATTKTVRYWGNDSVDACNHANVGDMFVENGPVDIHLCRDGYFQASPVGRFHPNPFGLHDMLGNVWEWCQDTYGKDAYLSHRRKNPVYKRVETDIDLRVIRGGSWQSGTNAIRCAKRSRNLPNNKFNVLGFRLVMESSK